MHKPLLAALCTSLHKGAKAFHTAVGDYAWAASTAQIQ